MVAEGKRFYTLWLTIGRERDRKSHAVARRIAGQAVRVAKDFRFQHKAAQAERGKHVGNIVWCCIRDILRAKKCLMSERTAVVWDEDGSECTSAEVQQERWKRHLWRYK